MPVSSLSEFQVSMCPDSQVQAQQSVQIANSKNQRELSKSPTMFSEYRRHRCPCSITANLVNMSALEGWITGTQTDF